MFVCKNYISLILDKILKKVKFLFVPYFRCKQLQDNQAVAWFFKNLVKYPPKQESCHRVGEKAEKPTKN